MVDYVNPYFAPDLDCSWAVNPGILQSVTRFAPMQNGSLGTMGGATLFSLTGTDYLGARIFRNVDGTTRFLGFRKQNIDEYTNAGVRTNRGTAYNAATAGWDAAEWGNQIIACNKLDATQSSTGAGFAALGGGSPKARYVASNLNFVMFYDVDDGGANVFADMIWWGGIRNPNTYVPSQSTQAGNLRLLSAPGPGRGIVKFRDAFIAFKDNAIIKVKWLGPPKMWAEELLSSRVGCIAPKTICELDGKLYFLHSSGFWEFDGQSLRNVGMPVNHSFLAENSYIAGLGSGLVVDGGLNDFDLTASTAEADDVEGIVWFGSAQKETFALSQQLLLYGYNVRTGRWGRSLHILAAGSGDRSVLVTATTADRIAFTGTTDTSGRFLSVCNTPVSAKLRSHRYPSLITLDMEGLSSEPALLTTGLFGDQAQSSQLSDLYLRHLQGGSTLAFGDLGGTVTGYKNFDQTVNLGTATLNHNTEFTSMQGKLDARYKAVSLIYGNTGTGRTQLIGMGMDNPATGKR